MFSDANSKEEFNKKEKRWGGRGEAPHLESHDVDSKSKNYARSFPASLIRAGEKTAQAKTVLEYCTSKMSPGYCQQIRLL